jgi:hypothetical protein
MSSFRGGWNYYQYGEGSSMGAAPSRYVQANNTTLELSMHFGQYI